MNVNTKRFMQVLFLGKNVPFSLITRMKVSFLVILQQLDKLGMRNKIANHTELENYLRIKNIL